MTTQYLHFYLRILILLTTIYYLQPLPLQELTFRRLHLPLQITVMVCRRFLPCIFLCSFSQIGISAHQSNFARDNVRTSFLFFTARLKFSTPVLRVSNFLRQSFVSQIFYASPSCLKFSTPVLRVSNYLRLTFVFLVNARLFSACLDFPLSVFCSSFLYFCPFLAKIYTGLIQLFSFR